MNSASYHAQAFEASLECPKPPTRFRFFSLDASLRHLNDWMEACQKEGLDVNDQTLLDQEGHPRPIAQWLLLKIEPGRGTHGWFSSLNSEILIQSLWKHGVTIDHVTPGPGDSTLLQLALGRDLLEITKLCIERGADVNYCGSSGSSPLFLASKNGHPSIVELLLKNGANPNLVPNGARHFPLHASLELSHLPIFELLLDHGANPNLKNEKGMTALHVAVVKGHFDEATRLIQQGVDLDTKNHLGETACHLAVHHLRPNLLQCLVESGARMDLHDHNFRTPLQKAKHNLTSFSYDVAYEENIPMIEFLTTAEHIAMEVAALKAVTAPQNPQSSPGASSATPGDAAISTIKGQKQSRKAL